MLPIFMTGNATHFRAELTATEKSERMGHSGLSHLQWKAHCFLPAKRPTPLDIMGRSTAR